MTAQTSTDSEVEALQQPKQPHLSKQDASTVDPTKLTALSPEVVSLIVVEIAATNDVCLLDRIQTLTILI